MTIVAAFLGFNASVHFPIATCSRSNNAFALSSFASSAPSGMSDRLRSYFGFPEELATLTLTLFIFGYCVGPLFWGPLSEQVRSRR